MTRERLSNLSFTKLVVDDVDRMADFYCDVFDLHRTGRLRIEQGAIGEPIEEMPEMGVRVAMVLDPEGHLCELVGSRA